MLRQRAEGQALPCVATLATDEVERLCCKNGLLFHELLSAFSLAESALPFRSGSHTLQLQSFRLQFVKASEMAPRPMELAERALAEALSLRAGTPEETASWLSADEAEGGAVVQVAAREDIPAAIDQHERRMPWHRRFRGALQQSLQYVEPELLACPPAMVLAVASTNEAPVHCFEELALAPRHWPPVFQNGQFNPQEVAKVLVLVHDEAEGGAAGVAQAAETLRQMKAAFPTAPCKLLRINSLPAEAPNLQQADVWSPALAASPASACFFPDPNSPRLRYPPVAAVRGCCLSSDDMLTLREFVLELTTKVVVPAMERRVFALQASVAQSRKGVKNFVKSFWRKPREAGEGGGSADGTGQGGAGGSGGGAAVGSGGAETAPVLYRFDRIEAQIRLLADTSFVMQDYEGALSSYKLARDDFKADKAWLHLGAAFEGMALCYHRLAEAQAPLFASQGAAIAQATEARYRRDMEAAIDEAVKAYLRRAEEESLNASSSPIPGGAHRVGPTLGARLATRASLLGAELLLAGSPPKAVDAAALLINAARRESPACAAALIEQAAWAYLKGGNIRKYAFYASMAGQLYLGCSSSGGGSDFSLEKHAVRCYSSALGIYEGPGDGGSSSSSSSGGSSSSGAAGGWTHVLEHIHLTLARELLKLQHPARALYHLLRLLASGHAHDTATPLSAPAPTTFSVKAGSSSSSSHIQTHSGKPPPPQLLTPEVQQQLVHDLLQTCRQHPGALAAVVPFLEAGAAALMRGLRRQQLAPPPPPPLPGQQQPLLQGQGVEITGLALPRVLEETLVVTQGGAEAGAGAVGSSSATEGFEATGGEAEAEAEMKRELHRELQTAAAMGARGGSMREWVDALGKVAKEEARARALAPTSSSAGGSNGGLMKWRGRGEAIAVAVELANPLNVPLVLTEMQVTATFEEEASGAQPSKAAAAPSSAASSEGAVEVEAQEVQLEPKGRQRVVLLVHPKRCGLLRLTGLRWRLFGEIWASTRFSLPGPLLQDSLEKRASRARGPNTRLASRIVPELPLLEAALEGIPDTLFQGEMVRGALTVTNRGLAPAALIYAKSSPHSWAFLRDPDPAAAAASEAAASGSGSGGGSGGIICMSMVGVSGTVFQIRPPGSGSLQPGASLRVPVWVRGLGGGKQRLRFLLRYEREGGIPAPAGPGAGRGAALLDGGGPAEQQQQFRYAHVATDVCVLPSVALAPSVSPSYARPGECVLTLNVTNYRTDGEAQARRVDLHSVVALSRLWRLEPILPPAAATTAAAAAAASGASFTPGATVADAAALEWQERSTLHYRLVPLPSGEGPPVLFEHELASGRLRVSGPGASPAPAASHAGMDDGFLPPATASSSSGPPPSSWASLDFLYVEHAAHSYQTAREEAAKRAVAQAVAASSGAPLSLGEIKRKEAEKKRQMMEQQQLLQGGSGAGAGAGAASKEGGQGPPAGTAAAAAAAGAGGGARPLSPRLGMGMESKGGGGGGAASQPGGGHLSALVPRGRATLSLLVTWSTEAAAGEEGKGMPPKPRPRRVGQHQVLNHAVRPLTLDPTTAAPLTITVQYPPLVRGRVGAGGLLQRCEAEVLVSVHNRMTDLPVDFVFEALTTPSGKRQSANRAAASPSFVWLGCTTRTVKGLQAGASVQLPVRAAFLRPGVYDLNRFRFVVHMAADSPQLVPGVAGGRLRVVDGRVRVPYIFSAQYVIRVDEDEAAAKANDHGKDKASALGGGGKGTQQQQQQQQRGGSIVGGLLTSALGLTAIGAAAEREGGGSDEDALLLTLTEKAAHMSLEPSATAGPDPTGTAAGAAGAAGASASSVSPTGGFQDIVATPSKQPHHPHHGAPLSGSPHAPSAFRFDQAEGAGEQRDGNGDGDGDGGEAVEVQEDQSFAAEGQERAAQLLELQGEGQGEGEGEEGAPADAGSRQH